jgi:hypothetical protein
MELEFMFMSPGFRRDIYSKSSLRLQMKTTRRYASIAGLGILATLLWASPLLTPAFAWHSGISTCVAGTWSKDCTVNPSFAIGTSVSDTAQITLTSNGGPYGTVYFAVAAGICTDHNSPLVSGPSPASITVTGSGVTTYTSTLSTTGLSAGSYVWLVYYSGTGSNGYPRAPASGYDCEPFTLFAAPPPASVPQFPFGMALLMAIALPALLLLKKKSSVSSLQTF